MGNYKDRYNVHLMLDEFEKTHYLTGKQMEFINKIYNEEKTKFSDNFPFDETLTERCELLGFQLFQNAITHLKEYWYNTNDVVE